MKMKGKVTGLGGIFVKAKDPEGSKRWYEEHLGLPCDQYGHLFAWREQEDPSRIGHTQFSVFESETRYLEPSRKDFMINFRVDDLEAIIGRLRKQGLEVVGEIEEFEYGKFGWVMDPDGTKIELWEPVDEVFTGAGEGSLDSDNNK